MKFIINSKENKAVNLANVIGFDISNNYLTLSLADGRSVLFVYGTEKNLKALFDAIIDFIANDKMSVFDCDEFLKTL